jgi:hypothetical protein
MSAALKTVEPQNHVTMPADIEGRIDAFANGRLYGWAWNRNRPDERLDIDIHLDGKPAATISADKPREDLKANGIGDGAYAFEIPIDAGPNATLTVQARSPSTGTVAPLRARSETETATEALLVQPIKRLQMLMEAIHLTQQQVQAGHQAVLRTLRELPRNTNDQTTAVTARLDGLSSSQQSLEQQVAGIEVFLLRIDETLRDLNGTLKRLPATRTDLPLRITIGALTAAVTLSLGLTLAFHTGLF